MRIAQLTELIDPTPPQKSGGVTRIVSSITEELVRRGHQVTLFGPKDSKTTARLVSVTDTALRNDTNLRSDGFELLFEYSKISSLESIIEKQDEFDIIHDHIGWRFLMFSGLIRKPIVSTIHGPTNNPPYRPYIFKKISAANKNVGFVTISKRQQMLLPEIQYAANIYHGIDFTNLTFEADEGEYFIYLGRITSEKGVHLAIDAAKAANSKLFIVGRCVTDQDRIYFEEKIKPHLKNKDVEYLGEIGDEEKNKLIGNAKAMINPIQWEEPFGLVMVESMACGTPVIAFANGSVPELIRDGETGFIINEGENWQIKSIIQKTGVNGLSEAVEMINRLDPAAYKKMRSSCRQDVEKNFTVERMVDDYEQLYNKIIQNNS